MSAMSSPSDPAPEPRQLPRELPFEHLDLPALGGHIGPEPEDFKVDEVPLYEASGQGDHWYVRLEKRERTTRDLCIAVAAASGAPEREIGYAGLKDKHAVTTQWLSVPAQRTAPPEAWSLGEGFRLLEVKRHGNKLRVGHLDANRFQIRLVDLDPAVAERVGPLCERVAKSGIGNAFGPQRFGLGQRNLDSALYALRRGRLNPRAGHRAKFMASVIQSEVFNRYLIARLAEARDRVVVGDVMRLEGSRSLFVVEDVAREQSRLDAGDIHLTGPMIGPKMKEAQGWPLELELAAAESLGLDAAALKALAPSAPGTRRDLLLRPTELLHEPAQQGWMVAFTLPAGAYASLVVRCLTRQEPWLSSDRGLDAAAD